MYASPRLAFALLLSAALLVGCQSAPILAVKSSYQEILYKLRGKGEQAGTAPEGVRREFSCKPQHTFELRLEQSRLLPTHLKSGREISHRIVYAACTPRDAVQKHPLVRRVIFGGRVLFEDRDVNFEVKPGRWTVDTFVGIPAGASPGRYALEVFFDVRGASERKLRQEFEVTN